MRHTSPCRTLVHTIFAITLFSLFYGAYLKGMHDQREQTNVVIFDFSAKKLPVYFGHCTNILFDHKKSKSAINFQIMTACPTSVIQ